MYDLTNKTVFITGATSGIGRACAEAFAARGARLILAARREEKLSTLSDLLHQGHGAESLCIKLDVRDRSSAERAVADLPDSWREVDILINNAGLALGVSKLQDADLDDADAMFDTNVKGLIYLSRLLVPGMIERNRPCHVINIGSTAGIQAYPGGALYCATKAAVKTLSDGLRMDTVDTPLRVTNIQPGMVETEFSLIRYKGDKGKAADVYKGLKPLTAADIADVILYAATVPPHVQICEVTITPSQQATGGVVYRK